VPPPLKIASPETSSFAPGLLFPMPTSPAEVMRRRSVPLVKNNTGVELRVPKSQYCPS
jgi:hypothetical protein